MSIPETIPVEHRRHAKYERLIARAKEVLAAATLGVHPCDEISLRAAAEATQAGLILHADSVRTRMASRAVAVPYADARRRTATLQAT